MIEHKQLDNGFEYIEIENKYAKAKVALQGAHLFYYKRASLANPLLWLSENAFFEEGKAIRGGVPICFPWFGKLKDRPELPQHGFARVSPWQVVKEEELSDGSTMVVLELTSNEERFNIWSYLFRVQLEIVVADVLEMRLVVENIDNKPFELSTALHSYFWVSDVANVALKGLEEKRYHDALDGQEHKQDEKLNIDQEIDRVYFDAENPLRLIDQERTLTLTSKGSKSLVLWNPWIEKSNSMKDMTKEGYRSMLCLETSNAMEDTRTIEPNQKHLLELRVSEFIN